MKLLVCLLFTLIATSLAGCKVDAPREVGLPAPFQSQGILVEVSGIVRTTTKYHGVSGRITNLTSEPIQSCTLVFQALGSRATAGPMARVETGPIGPREQVDFRASFPAPYSGNLEHIVRTKVSVKRGG